MHKQWLRENGILLFWLVLLGASFVAITIKEIELLNSIPQYEHTYVY